MSSTKHEDDYYPSLRDKPNHWSISGAMYGDRCSLDTYPNCQKLDSLNNYHYNYKKGDRVHFIYSVASTTCRNLGGWPYCLIKEVITLLRPRAEGDYFFFLLVTSAMTATTDVNPVAKKIPN